MKFSGKFEISQVHLDKNKHSKRKKNENTDFRDDSFETDYIGLFNNSVTIYEKLQ